MMDDEEDEDDEISKSQQKQKKERSKSRSTKRNKSNNSKTKKINGIIVAFKKRQIKTTLTWTKKKDTNSKIESRKMYNITSPTQSSQLSLGLVPGRRAAMAHSSGSAEGGL